MLLRYVRWGLTGVLVGMLLAATVIRAFGLDREWPLVPLLAFTPDGDSARAAAGACVRRWSRQRLQAVVTGGCAPDPIGISRRAWSRTARRRMRPGVRLRVLAANVAGNDPAAPEVVGARTALRRRRLQRRRARARACGAYDAAARIGELLPHRVLHPLPGFSRHRPVLTAPTPAAQDRIGTRLRPSPPPGAPARRRARRRSSPSTCRPHGPESHRTLAATTCASCRPRARPRRCACSQATSTPRSTTPSCGGCSTTATTTPPSRPGAACARRGRPRTPFPTLVTIDHVLADRRVRVISARTVAIPGSDHRGVLAELVLPRG